MQPFQPLKGHNYRTGYNAKDMLPLGLSSDPCASAALCTSGGGWQNELLLENQIEDIDIGGGGILI
jgi:hypothetical protein